MAISILRGIMELFLDNLFRVARTVALPGGKEVIVRALSDPELRSRESLARSEAAKYRAILRDPNSDEHIAFVASLEELKDQELIDLIVTQYSQLEAQDEARSQAKPEFIPLPDEATDSEKLDNLDEQAADEKRANELYASVLKNMTDNFRKNVETWDRNKLLIEAKSWNIRGMAYTTYLRASIMGSLYYATENKNGKRYFANLESLENTNQLVVNTLYDSFVSVNEISSWDVSKATLQGETTG